MFTFKILPLFNTFQNKRNLNFHDCFRSYVADFQFVGFGYWWSQHRKGLLAMQLVSIHVCMAAADSAVILLELDVQWD